MSGCDVVVVGAGLAGIACARALAAGGRAPVVLDKGRGIGGRMATRRVTLPDGTALQFDHGAQYLTARGAGFAAVLEGLAAQGAALAWRGAWVGGPGMSGLVRALAGPLDVRQGVEVTGLHPDGTGWRLETSAGPLHAGSVVLTVPAPQAAALLGPGHPLHAAVAGVEMEPGLTLMAAFAGGPHPTLADDRPPAPFAWIAQDSTKPGRPEGATSWVAQADAAFSAAHLEMDRDALCALLLERFAGAMGLDPNAALYAAAHRWRYARVAQAPGRPFLRAQTLWVGGDWCLGPRAEDAFDSGTAIAADLLGAA